jgi:hypothetical protein
VGGIHLPSEGPLGIASGSDGNGKRCPASGTDRREVREHSGAAKRRDAQILSIKCLVRWHPLAVLAFSFRMTGKLRDETGWPFCTRGNSIGTYLGRSRRTPLPLVFGRLSSAFARRVAVCVYSLPLPPAYPRKRACTTWRLRSRRTRRWRDQRKGPLEAHGKGDGGRKKL